MFYVVAFLVTLLAVGIVFALIRLVADVVVFSVTIGAVAVVAFGIHSEILTSWGEVIGASLLVGGGAGLLCLPVLPFSSVYKQSSNG